MNFIDKNEYIDFALWTVSEYFFYEKRKPQDFHCSSCAGLSSVKTPEARAKCYGLAIWPSL